MKVEGLMLPWHCGKGVHPGLKAEYCSGLPDEHTFSLCDLMLDLSQHSLPNLLVHGQVTIIFVVSVGLSVCLSVCFFVQSFSQPSDPISIKLGHTLYVWV